MHLGQLLFSAILHLDV